MQAVHSFIVDGDEAFEVVSFALNRAIEELQKKSGLTISVKDVTIERNPHGRGMWNYTVKVNSHETK